MKIKPITLTATAAVAATSLLLTGCVTERVVERDSADVTTTRRSTTSVSTYEPGYTVQTLPRGYTTRTVSGRQYYLADDVYYTQDTNGYTVVTDPASPDYLAANAPPIRTGVVRNPSGPSTYLTTLPGGYTTRTYNGRDYYVSGTNTYARDSRGYVIVDSPF